MFQIILIDIKISRYLFCLIFIFNHSEMANLGVTLVDENNEIVGYAALYDQPNWLLDKSVVWTELIRNNFAEEKCDVIFKLFCLEMYF